MADRRVVVTGMGVVACNGHDTASFWDALQAGRHGIATLPSISPDAHGTTFGGAVDLDDVALADGDKRAARRKDRFVLLALKAAREAMEQAGHADGEWEDPFKIATIVGSGIGGLKTIESELRNFIDRGARRVSPFLVPKMIVDSAAGDISIAYGAKGPNYCITTACATATHCIGNAFQLIKSGRCDAAITGGCEAPISDLGLAGFNAAKALSTRNDSPETASRPFDADREGFVIAEGAGILFIESLERAQARGATILGEIVGFGCTGDAFHETAPDPEGTAGAMALRHAIEEAGIEPSEIDYMNAHGTSTKINDRTETMVIKNVFGDHAHKLPVSSTKSMTGHTLGAAGGVEAIACLKALQDGVIPPTINYTTPDPECDLDYVPNTARQQDLTYALSNNLGLWWPQRRPGL